MIKQSSFVVIAIIACAPLAMAEPAGLKLPSQAELQADSVASLQPPDVAVPTTQAFATQSAEANRRLRRIDYDALARAKELGPGVEPSFQFVRDRIRFEVYPGVLRGDEGTYLSGAGNAADRSLLLAAFLKTKGIPVRFALGHLPVGPCDVLLKQMFATGAAQRAAAADDARPPSSPRSADLVRGVRARAARDYATICRALGGKLPIGGAMPSHDELLKEIAPHVWVQAQVDGRWTDLDASFADSTPGKTHCDAERTVEELPDDLFQKLTMRVRIERLDGASLKSEVPLEVTRRVVDLADRQIFLVHASESGLAAVGHAIAGGGKDVWVPALWIDGEGIPGQPVTFNDSAAAVASGSGGALRGALEGFGAAPAADASPRFVAETVEFVLAVPGRWEETTRQVLCESAGAAWRRTTPLDSNGLRPLVRDAKGPVEVQAVRNIWVSFSKHNLNSYAGATKLLADSMAGGGGTAAAAEQQAQDNFGLEVWPLAIQNFSCVLFGEQLFLPALNDDPSIRFYTDTPRIIVFGLTLSPAPGSDTRVSIESSIDLRRDRVRGVSLDPKAGEAVARRKIWYGALEGAMEHEISAREAGPAGADVSVSSTSGLLDGRGVALLEPGGAAPGWEKLARNRETAARLAAGLAAGDFAIVPKAAVEGDDPAWWAVSSTNADTVAVWGRDGHMAVWKNGGGSGDFGRTGGGSSGPGVNYVDDQGNRLVPKKTKGKGGTEYSTIVFNISLPGSRQLAITITPRLLKVTFEVWRLFL